MSCPNSALSAEAQPSYCFSRWTYFCQRAWVSLKGVPPRSVTVSFSSLSRSTTSSSSDSFSM